LKKEVPALLRNNFVFAGLKHVIIRIPFLFSFVKIPVVNVIENLKIRNRAWMLPVDFTLARDILFPLLKPFLRNKVDRHSFHDGRKIIVAIINVDKFLFLVAENLFGN
jgi:hypothetical protein